MRLIQPSDRIHWERFQSEGVLSKEIDPIVASSWKRLRHIGVQAQIKAAPMAESSELSTLLNQMQPLRDLSSRAYNQSSEVLKDSGCMIALATPAGTVIDVKGDQRIIERGHENSLSIGGQWGEQFIGTNAIGTSIIELAPTFIHGANHYCDDIQRWSCAAAPIFDPFDGSLRGVLDISGASDVFLPQNFFLAITLARQISDLLALDVSEQHAHLFDHLTQYRKRLGQSHTMLVDRRGMIINDTHAPQPPYACSASSLEHLEDELWLETLLQENPNHDIEPIVNNGALIGAVLVASRRNEARRKEAPDPFEDFVGLSDVIKDLKSKARNCAQVLDTVIINGEPGSGRRLLARAIHNSGGGLEDQFVALECAAQSDSAELIGVVADHLKTMREGTLCIDGATMLSQASLTDIAKTLRRTEGVVAKKKRKMRVILLTELNGPDKARLSKLQGETFADVESSTLDIPPLRNQTDDIIEIAKRFIRQAAKQAGRPIPVLTSNAQKVLKSYLWPGNIRELRVEMNSLVLFCRGGIIGSRDLPRHFFTNKAAPTERERIAECLMENQWNVSATARALNMARSTLYLKLEAYQLTKRFNEEQAL